MINRILIDRWRMAYEKVNGKLAPEIEYNYGWYRISNNIGSPFRQRKLLEMAQRLESRVSNGS